MRQEHVSETGGDLAAGPAGMETTVVTAGVSPARQVRRPGEHGQRRSSGDRSVDPLRPGPVHSGTVWRSLLGSLLAGVVAAILVNSVLRPEPAAAPGEPAATTPLGLLTSSASAAAGRSDESLEADRVEISEALPAVEVFVPVPESAVGAPPAAPGMPL